MLAKEHNLITLSLISLCLLFLIPYIVENIIEFGPMMK